MAGSGGQGIILAGKILASTSVRNTPYITFFPFYGAEVRGGTSSCQVTLSNKEISSPLSEQFDSIIVMNQASADKFRRQMTKGCLVLLNSSLCKAPSIPARVLSVDATRLADKLGDTRAANFIMLGAYLAVKPVISPSQAEQGINELLSGKDRSLVNLNIMAFRTGLKA